MCLLVFTGVFSDSSNYVGLDNNMNIIMKPTNSPTQGQPNPRKNRLKVAFWANLSHSD